LIQIGSLPLIQTGIVRGACPHDIGLSTGVRLAQ
jgi:hypothetical protein